MDLLEHEAIGDPAEAAPAGNPVEAPAAVEPEAAAPEPQYLTAEQAADIADARFNALLAQYEQPAAPTPGEPVDWNERLNPLDPSFGQNFVDLLAQRDEWTLGQLKAQLAEVVGPLSQQAQAASQASNEQALDGVIASELERAGAPESAAPIVKNLARSYYPALSARLGPNAGANAAMAQAIKEVNALASASRQSGGADNATQLNALATANAQPGTNSAVSDPPAGTVAEGLERFKARLAGSTLTEVA